MRQDTHPVRSVITKSQLLHGRDKEYPLTPESRKNLDVLHLRLNAFIEIVESSGQLPPGFLWKVSSGYRPGHYNTRVGGAKRSAHLLCQAVDLVDKDDVLDKLIDANPHWLVWAGFDREDPKATKSWVHLDTKKRAKEHSTFKV